MVQIKVYHRSGVECMYIKDGDWLDGVLRLAVRAKRSLKDARSCAGSAA
jgi:hypothetical protein